MFQNLAPGCGMVWAEFWTDNSGMPFRKYLKQLTISIDCDNDGTPHSALWDPDLDHSKPQSDIWTPSYQYKIGNYYEAVVQLST